MEPEPNLPAMPAPLPVLAPMPLDGQVLPDLPDDLLHHHHHHHHMVGDATQDQEGSEEELESSQTPKKRKLDSIRAGLPAHGLRITQSQVMRMLKMIQEDPSMRKDFYLVTDHPLYELIVKKPTANKCMEMMSAIAPKDKGSPDPTIKIDLNFELGETMNRTGTQWGGCYIKLTPSKHSMSRKSRLRERVIPYPAYPGDPAVYTGPFTTSPGPAGHAGVVVGGMPGVAPPSPPGLPLPPFTAAGAGGDPRGMGLRVGAKRAGDEEDEQQQQQQQQQQMVQEARTDANGQDENGSFQSAMSWLYGTWDRRDRLLQERAAIIHQLQREREEMRLGLEERDTILRQRDEEVNRMREEINLLLREMQKLKEGGTEESSTEELFLLEKILESSRNVVRERIKRSAELKEEKKVDEAVAAGVEPPAPMAV